MARLDQPIFDMLNLSQGPLTGEGLINGMTLITHLGSGVVLIMVTAATSILLAERKNYRRAVVWFCSVAAIFLLSAFLKQVFGADRPDVIYRLVHASSPSFPSGHSLRSAFVYPGAVIALGTIYNFPQKPFIRAAIILAVVIGLSRIMLGVHWPVDVLAGWVIGAGAVLLWARLNRSNFIQSERARP